MYGAIIYNKAPIMMRQLEMLIGEDLFRDRDAGVSAEIRIR